MSNQIIDSTKIEEKFIKNDQKKRKKMKVNSKSVLKLKKMIVENSTQKPLK